MTEVLFYQWLEFFHQSIPPARPALLIVDNHESRFSLRIIERCMEQQITLLLLPPNATHLMQVGDVAVHAPFKKAIRKQVGVFIHQHPRTSITKHHYAQIIAPAYTDAFSPTNVEAGYKATGIVPFNPDKTKRHLPSTSNPSSLPCFTPSSLLPLSSILTIPGSLASQPPAPSPTAKRAGIPATRILTSTQMKDYFQEQKKQEEQKENQKVEKKRVREEKKAAEAIAAADRPPKRTYRKPEQQAEEKQAEEEKQRQKEDQKRLRQEKKAAEAARPKRKYTRRQLPASASAAAAAEPEHDEADSDKENICPSDDSDEDMEDDEEEEDDEYRPPPAVVLSVPSSTRPSRGAAEMARAQIYAASLSS
jgi:hypothetical protein